MINPSYLQELSQEIHQNAVDKGFWDEYFGVEHYMMLVITELSEAVEAFRKNHRADRKAYNKWVQVEHFEESFERYIKDSIEDELADACIRLLDVYAAYSTKGDISEVSLSYCKNQIPIDGFPSQIFPIVQTISFPYSIDNLLSKVVSNSLGLIGYICDLYDIDLLWHIKEKMLYNATRPRLHGKNC